MGWEESVLYPGFFLISTAIERMLKLVIIIDHMRRNQMSPPSFKTIRNYNHNIDGLFDDCAKIAESIGLSDFKLPGEGSVERDIMDFMMKFANGVRYFNIDSLTGEKPKVPCPITQWDVILARLLFERDGEKSSEPPEDSFCMPAFRAQAAPFAIEALHEVIRPPMKLLGEIAFKTGQANIQVSAIPHMDEFFSTFWTSTSQLRKKKRWP